MPTPAGYVNYSIEMLAVGDPEPWVVTFATTAELSSIPAETHADRMFAAVQQNIMPRAWDGMSLSRVVARVGQDGGDDVIAESTLGPVAGGLAGGFLPQNSALLVRKVSGLGGRRNRGRSYWPGLLRDGDVSNVGQLEAGVRADLQGRMDDFMDSLLATDPGPALQPVILHRTGVLAPTPFSQYVVEPTVATQRNRLRR